MNIYEIRRENGHCIDVRFSQEDLKCLSSEDFFFAKSWLKSIGKGNLLFILSQSGIYFGGEDGLLSIYNISQYYFGSDWKEQELGLTAGRYDIRENKFFREVNYVLLPHYDPQFLKGIISRYALFQSSFVEGLDDIKKDGKEKNPPCEEKKTGGFLKFFRWFLALLFIQWGFF